MKTGIQVIPNKDETHYDLLINVERNSQNQIVKGIQTGGVLYQNQAFILRLQKGEIKEHPTVGVGINDLCNDNDFDMWKRSITEQLERDGQLITKLILTSQQFEVESRYSEN